MLVCRRLPDLQKYMERVETVVDCVDDNEATLFAHPKKSLPWPRSILRLLSRSYNSMLHPNSVWLVQVGFDLVQLPGRAFLRHRIP
jgi:hypothetical protein